MNEICSGEVRAKEGLGSSLDAGDNPECAPKVVAWRIGQYSGRAWQLALPLTTIAGSKRCATAYWNRLEDATG